MRLESRPFVTANLSKMESTTEEHRQDVEQRKRTDSQPADDKKERYVDKFSHERMFPGDVV